MGLLVGKGSLWGIVKCSKINFGDDYTTLNILKAIDLETLLF